MEGMNMDKQVDTTHPPEFSVDDLLTLYGDLLNATVLLTPLFGHNEHPLYSVYARLFFVQKDLKFYLEQNHHDALVTWFGTDKPTIVCLCGSTRFSEAYELANALETLKGHIVLSIGVDLRKQRHAGLAISTVYSATVTSLDEKLDDVKRNLDFLHLSKIDLADEILILNVDGYVGNSTRREIEYARSKGKVIRWWEPDKVPEGL